MWFLLGCSDFALVHEKKIPGETGDSGDADTDTDTDTDTDSDTDTTPAVCNRILVYSTEGESGPARGTFDGLRSDPALSTFDLSIREQAVDGPLMEDMLTGRSQLWIFGTWADRGTTFSLSQVSAIRDFVEAGNGLLLAGGEDSGETDYTDDVNLLAQLWGVTYSGSVAEGADGTLVRPEGATGPLMTGVSEVPAFSGTAELTVDDPAVDVAFRIDGNDAVAWRDDGVRVVFDRSWGGWRDLYRTGDQMTYVSNVATFLEPCP